MTSWSYAIPAWILGSLIYLLVGGLLVRFTLGLTLRLAHPTWPRARYWLAVTAFAAAVLLPLLSYLGAVEAAFEDRGPMLLISSSPDAVYDFSPAKDREAFLKFVLTGGPARYFVYLWMLGVLALAARGLFSLARLWRLRWTWQSAPEALRARLEWPDGVQLHVAEHGVPLATGILRPTVFLPLWLFERLNGSAIRSIARHELAHLRWRDPLVDLAVRATRTLFWPSLGLWSIEKVIRREREAAADLEALAGADDSPSAAFDYAESLAAVARGCLGLRGTRTAHALGALGELEDRAARLLSPPAATGPTRFAVALSIAVLGALSIDAVPFPSWLEAPNDETAIWGPLDHLLGFNPIVDGIETPDGLRVRVQGHVLSAEESERWLESSNLSELAATVLEAETRAAAAASTDSS